MTPNLSQGWKQLYFSPFPSEADWVPAVVVREAEAASLHAAVQVEVQAVPQGATEVAWGP